MFRLARDNVLLKPPQTAAWAELQSLEDNELARLLRAGNHDAFAVLVDRYQRLVFSVAARIVKDTGEAEDVVQIVFLDLLRSVDQFDPARGTLKTWVLQYAYSRSMNRHRHLGRQQFYSRLELQEVKPSEYAIGTVRPAGLSSAETARLIEQALAQLSPPQRRAIELCYFEGLKIREAAEKMGNSEQSVHHHYYRGLMKLREFLHASKQPTEEKPASPAPGKIRWEVANADT
jgi:RNA polymerase sigma-70 factor, ECF subfamily